MWNNSELVFLKIEFSMRKAAPSSYLTLVAGVCEILGDLFNVTETHKHISERMKFMNEIWDVLRRSF